jgi:VIT1/CCC1 family predicted Fe2+/Mn2+ transporter
MATVAGVLADPGMAIDYAKQGIRVNALAHQVAKELMAHDALAAHARDELGISAALRARPVQAAFTSALMFAVGAALPLIIVFLAPDDRLVPAVAGASLLCLGILGWLAARTGGARPAIGAARVVFWGVLAMGLTATIGALFGTSAG